MPGTEYAEDCMPVLSLSEGLELNTQLFLEMQIKKMKEIIPQLYTDQVNDRNNSLTTSPKQLGSEYVSQSNGNEAQPHGHQDTKAEDDKTSMITCVRCRSVYKIPLQELKKDNQHGQSEDQMFFVCVKCNLGVSPTFPCMNDIPSAIDSGNKDNTISRTITNQFKVKNFQPGKYYCDKCRFSTKDPLQYKKHTLLHEEIKFFCSHCSYVSYTKGEFQRHLVKHTGTFPYRCEYCDYGAVRNDYIVKHTRRVHETGGEKRPLKQTGEHQPKRTNFSKQNSEVLVNEVSKSNSFLDEPSDLSLCFPGHGDQDKGGHAISLPESKECSKVEAASAPDKACLPEPSKVNLFENENVEVELLSPAKEPVQPGVPLTVVAPAELRVPDNCLAQLIDIKVVNGTQQLVLKLIPLKEKNGLKPGSSDEGKYEFVNKSTVPNEQEKLVPVEQTSPAMERSPEKPFGNGNLHSTDYTHLKDLDCRKASVPQVLKDKSETNQSRCESCPNSDRIGNWRQEVLSVPYTAALSPVSSRDGDSKQNNYFSSVSVVNNSALCSPMKRSGVFPHIPALSPYQDKSQNRLEKPPSDCKPAEAVRAFAERGTLPVSPGAFLHRNEVGTFKMVTFNEKLKQAQVKEPSDDPNPIQGSTLRSEQSHINLISENDIKTQNPEEVILEDLVGVTVQNSGSNITSSDGPIISSVFSLSSGAENIPEGIYWDNISCRTKSDSSLHTKITQLITTTESSKSSLSPLSIVEQHSSPLKTPIDCVLGHNALSHDPVLPQGLRNNAADNEQFTFEQMQQQDRKSSLSPLSIVKQHSSPLRTPIDSVLGHNALHHDPVLPQRLQNNAADNEQFTFEQMQQQDRKSSLSPLSIVEQHSSPLKTPIDCVLGQNALCHDPVLPQGLCNNAADNKQFPFEQMQQQNSVEEQTKARETRKDPDTAPVFIPKETVLKAFNSTEKEHLVGNKLPCDMFGNERLLPKSVPFNSLEQVGEDFSLTNESQSTDSSRNLGISLEDKPNQEFATSTISNITNSACSPPKEGNDQDEEGKLIFGGPSGSKIKKKSKTQSESSHLLPDVCIYMTSRHLRLMPVRREQLIKCPRRNQPVVVLNHPDVDSIEVINVMKVVNKYKSNVLKVVLSERTCDQLGIKRHHRRLIYRNMEAVFPVKKQTVLKMKLKKIHKNSYQVVDTLPRESVQGMFKCWFCGRIYEDQEEWMSHGQRHLIEATRDWEQLSPPLGVPK